MGDRVSQDPEELQRIVNIMGEKVERYNALCQEVIKLIDEKIGPDYNVNRAWWGNNAQNFSKRVNADLNHIFDDASRSINELKENLKRQMEAWRRFEGQ